MDAGGRKVTVVVLGILFVSLGTACADRGEPVGVAPVDPSAPGDEPAPAPGTLDWEDCLGGECATLTVPLDHEAADGPTIDLALLRIPAGDPGSRIGSLLVNPGGPGGSGVEFVRENAAFLDPELRERFDVVGFDPRGTGSSNPIECARDLDPLLALDPSPDNGAERAALRTAYRAVGSACQEAQGELLPHLTTSDAARDIDLIRRAVGDDQLSYLGYSYGTYLGAVYADLFPDRVRALVLDGAIDPESDALESSLNQVRGFERSLDEFLASCAEDAECAFQRGGEPGAALDALLADLEQAPLPVGDRTLGESEAYFGIVQPLYGGRLGWDDLAEALDAAADGDGEALLDLADDYTRRDDDGRYDPTIGAFWAISCVDGSSVGPADSYPALEDSFREAGPRLGVASLYSGLVCSEWPVEPQPVTLPLDAPGAAPIVVIGTTEDPATPYDQAVALAHQLDRATLLTSEGELHTAAAAFGVSECIDRYAVRYLVELTLPPPDARCTDGI